MVKTIIRLEGLAIFISSIVIYHSFEGNWLLFILFLLVPDISMIGYVKNRKLGAATYNAVHNYFAAFIIFSIGMWFGISLLIFAGLILGAHVGVDRLFGFGLKYPTDFKDTHMGKI